MLLAARILLLLIVMTGGAWAQSAPVASYTTGTTCGLTDWLYEAASNGTADRKIGCASVSPFTQVTLTCDGGTDNVTALQAAITAATSTGSTGGGNLLTLVPNGTGLCVTSPLTVACGLTFRAAGPNIVYLALKSGATTPLITVSFTCNDPGGFPNADVLFDGVQWTSVDQKCGSGCSTAYGTSSALGRAVALYLKTGTGTRRPSVILNNITCWAMPSDCVQLDTFNGDLLITGNTQLYNTGRYALFCSSSFDIRMIGGQIGVTGVSTGEPATHNVVLSGCTNYDFIGVNNYSAAAVDYYIFGTTEGRIIGGAVDDAGGCGIEFSSLSASNGLVVSGGTRFSLNGRSVAAAHICATSGTGHFTLNSPIFGAGGANWNNFDVSYGTTTITSEMNFPSCRGGGQQSCAISAGQQMDFGDLQRPTAHKNILDWAGDANINPKQRGSSFTGITGATPVQVMDGWFAFTGGTTTMSVSVLSDTTQGFGAKYRMARTSTGTDPIFLCHIEETADSIPLQNLNLVVSEYAQKGSGYTGGTALVSIYLGSGADQGSAALAGGTWTNVRHIDGGLVPPASWNQNSNGFPGLIAAASAAEKEIALCFTYTGSGAASNDYLELNWIQMEVGNYPTGFIHTTAADALRRAQRYFESSYDPGVVPGTATEVGEDVWEMTVAGATIDAVLQGHSIHYQTSKFQPGTVSLWNPKTLNDGGSGGAAKVYNTGGSASTGATVFQPGRSGFTFTAIPTAAASFQFLTQWSVEAAP